MHWNFLLQLYRAGNEAVKSGQKIISLETLFWCLFTHHCLTLPLHNSPLLFCVQSSLTCIRLVASFLSSYQEPGWAVRRLLKLWGCQCFKVPPSFCDLLLILASVRHLWTHLPARSMQLAAVQGCEQVISPGCDIFSLHLVVSLDVSFLCWILLVVCVTLFISNSVAV